MDEIKSRVDEWRQTGADNIFFDNFGCDYGVSRSRQNEAVEYVHDQDMSVLANVLHPENAFGETDTDCNPSNIPTKLDSRDFYLYEGHQIKQCEYVSEADWQDKANKIKSLQDKIGFKVFSITTCNEDDFYSQNMFFYSWYSALIYGHEATGWGDKDFTSDGGKAPFYSRPDIDPGAFFTSDVINESPIYKRMSDKREICVDTSTHEFGIDGCNGGGVALYYRNILKIKK